ncbi:MAG: hypothetical protein ACERK0_15720 [Deltaproteobacteria bacterium]
MQITLIVSYHANHADHHNHIYHPDFRGKFSIKNVVPALLPHLAYDNLDVADGQAASNHLERLLCRPEELTERECADLRAQLCAYCEHDTAVMVELWRVLEQVAPTSA